MPTYAFQEIHCSHHSHQFHVFFLFSSFFTKLAINLKYTFFGKSYSGWEVSTCCCLVEAACVWIWWFWNRDQWTKIKCYSNLDMRLTSKSLVLRLASMFGGVNCPFCRPPYPHVLAYNHQFGVHFPIIAWFNKMLLILNSCFNKGSNLAFQMLWLHLPTLIIFLLVWPTLFSTTDIHFQPEPNPSSLDHIILSTKIKLGEHFF